MTGTPEIAVVIPVYEQSQFVIDAVTSVLGQSSSCNIRTVLVNDGCPRPETDTLCRFLARANPGRITYVKQANAGLSAARNRAIRLALSLWPSVRAIFPLDADNALSPTTLERLLERLDSSGADWVYVDQETMGARAGTIRRPQTFSIYRLLVSNYCDAGSLIHRRLFDDGLWFESPDPSFPEDWHFFSRAALSGYRGVHLPDAGFLYRVLGGAMHDRQPGPHRLSGPYWPAEFSPRDGARILRLEHAEMPRFAFVDPGADSVTFGSHPALAPSAVMSVSQFVNIASEQSPAQDAGATYVPPFAVVAAADVIEALVTARLWDGVAFAATGDLANAGKLEVSLAHGPPAWRPGGFKPPHVTFLRTSPVDGAPVSQPPSLHACVPRALSEPPPAYSRVAGAIEAAASSRGAESVGAAIHGHDRAFADLVHGRGHRRFMLTPDEDPTGVVVSAARLGSGDVPWEVLGGSPIHLVVIGEQFEPGELPSHVTSTALVRPDGRMASELASALHPCGRAWLLDVAPASADLAQSVWMGISLTFLTSARDVLFEDSKLGIAWRAATSLGGLVSSYAVLSHRIEALLSAWGVPDSKLAVLDGPPVGRTTAA